MALILAAVFVIGTCIIDILMIFANGMSDAPSVQGIPVMPTFIGGMLLAAALAGSHWLHFSW